MWTRSQAVVGIPHSELQKLVREDKVARALVWTRDSPAVRFVEEAGDEGRQASTVTRR